MATQQKLEILDFLQDLHGLRLKFCRSELTIAFLRIDSAMGSAGISITIANSTLILFCIGIQNKIATEFLQEKSILKLILDLHFRGRCICTPNTRLLEARSTHLIPR